MEKARLKDVIIWLSMGDELKVVLNSLNSVTDKLLRLSLNMMKNVESLVDPLILLNEKLTEETALEFLQSASLEISNDARSVSDEIDEFSKFVLDSTDPVEDITPFLSQVWYGDMYDSGGIDGIKMLSEELSTQLDSINDKALIQMAFDKSIS